MTGRAWLLKHDDPGGRCLVLRDLLDLKAKP